MIHGYLSAFNVLRLFNILKLFISPALPFQYRFNFILEIYRCPIFAARLRALVVTALVVTALVVTRSNL